MGAVENVFVPASTGDGGDLASVKADGHFVRDLWLRGRGRLRYGAAQVKPCRRNETRVFRRSRYFVIDYYYTDFIQYHLALTFNILPI